MRDGFVDKKWFNELLIKRGIKSQKELAKAIGLDGPKLTNLLNGKRRAQVQELLAMSHILDTPMMNLVQCFDAKHIHVFRAGLHVHASVFDDDHVEFHDSMGNPLNETIEMPIPDYTGMGVHISTANLSPRYFEGEILAARIEPDPGRADVKHLLGREAFVLVSGIGLLLKILQSGSRPGLYNLSSLNIRTPPMVNVDVVCGEPIDFHIPGWFRPKYQP